MNARLTISNKLLIGFGSLVLTVIINGLVTYSTSNSNRKLNEDILNIYNPSLSCVRDCYNMVNNSLMLIKSWVYIEKQSDTKDKRALVSMHDVQYPSLQANLNEVSKTWSPEDRAQLQLVLKAIGDTLFVNHKFIMNSLKNFSDYDDLMVTWEITPMVEQGGVVVEQTDRILAQLEALTASISKETETANRNMMDSFLWFQNFVFVSLLIIVAVIVIVTVLTTRSIVLPLNTLKDFLVSMTKGVLPKDKLVTANDEIGDMGDALNGFIDSLRRTSEFAVEIGNGKFDSDYEALGEEDTLGNALLDMRRNLRDADVENRKRKAEDDIRNWETKGLADFGDILRQNSSDMDLLASNLMRHLIDYLGVNQGAIYILNNDDSTHPFFEMKSAVAYNREKYLRTNFEINEGLVGRCAFEKLPVYLKEIPHEYIVLTSGLGGAEPSQLLLTPLIKDDEVLGVIEVASFNDIPSYQIDFMKTLGENVALTISNVRTAEQTARLYEESKMKGEELASQEEELRQNMEELKATQEESARREAELQLNFDALNNSVVSATIDASGTILGINSMIEKKTRNKVSDYVGKTFIERFVDESQLANFEQVWSSVMAGQSASVELKNPLSIYWLQHTLTPLVDSYGNVNKVLDIMIDVTAEHRLADLGL